MRQVLLCATFEAVIGALDIDQGCEAGAALCRAVAGASLEQIVRTTASWMRKAVFRSWSSRKACLPRYTGQRRHRSGAQQDLRSRGPCQWDRCTEKVRVPANSRLPKWHPRRLSSGEPGICDLKMRLIGRRNYHLSEKVPASYFLLNCKATRHLPIGLFLSLAGLSRRSLVRTAAASPISPKPALGVGRTILQPAARAKPRT